MASSKDFCVHIGTCENRVQIIDLSKREGKILYAADGVVTDMAFVPNYNDTLATASRDQYVSIWHNTTHILKLRLH